MLEEYAPAFKRIEAWWNNGAIGRACIAFDLPKPGRGVSDDLNRFWLNEDSKPDFQKMLDLQIRYFELTQNFGESISGIRPCLGERQNALSISWFLGGKVRFGETTVWCEPVIDDWDKFKIDSTRIITG